MRRFQNILLLYEHKLGDEAALDRAVQLAMRNHARLTVAHPIPELPTDAVAAYRSLSLSEEDLQTKILDEKKAHLERLVAFIRQSGVEVETTVLVGKPFLETIRAVHDHDFDLVVAAAEMQSGARSYLFGSTSMHLMRKCPCPVWVIHPTAGKRFQRILAAVDPDVTADKPAPLDLKIMQLASSLAQIEDCHLDIVHVWDFKGPDLDTSRSELTPQIWEKLVTRNQAAHSQSVGRLIDAVELDGISYDVHLPRGDASTDIPKLAQERGTDLIVMGTVGKTGIAGFFIGETAENVLNRVTCSVLTAKPDGFVSPVPASNYK